MHPSPFLSVDILHDYGNGHQYHPQSLFRFHHLYTRWPRVCVCVCVCSPMQFPTCSFCVAATTSKIRKCSTTACAITLRPTYHLSLFQSLTCSFISGGSYKWNHIVSNIWGLAFLFCIIRFQSIQVVHVAIGHSFLVAERYCIVCSPFTR